MIIRDVAQLPALNMEHHPHSSEPMANSLIHPSVKHRYLFQSIWSLKDMTRPYYCGVGNCQLFKHDFIIPPFQESEIYH